MSKGPAWYANRLRAMGHVEIRHRLHEQFGRRVWTAADRLARPVPGPTLTGDASVAPDPPQWVEGWRACWSPQAARRVVEGPWSQLGTAFFFDGNWLLDPLTGITAPTERSFTLSLSDRATVGDIRQLWELNRLQHLPVLAAGFAMTRDEHYAETCRDHVDSWLDQNPFLRGPNWTSGIEIGLRVISLVWTRRLLDDWTPVGSVFEDDPRFVASIGRHLQWLDRFRSTGSSANNHAVAEAAGLFVGATAWPWFRESLRWRQSAGAWLAEVTDALTMPSGLNRELASHYHLFTLELLLAAITEDLLATESALPAVATRVARQMTGALGHMCDSTGRLARQGDSDDANVLMIDRAQSTPAGALAWAAVVLGPLMLADGGRSSTVTGPQTDARAAAIAALLGGDRVTVDAPGAATTDGVAGPDERVALDADGFIVRSFTDATTSRWFRMDCSPHGATAIAAHAHADALAIELRVDGRDVIADPGTYRYSAVARRSYYRSTRAHSTVTLDDGDQSTPGGPFLWVHHATTRSRVVTRDDGSTVVEAEHDGYRPSTHRRSVHVAPDLSWFEVVDSLDGPAGRLATCRFVCGPEISLRLRHDALIDLVDHGGAEVASAELLSEHAWTSTARSAWYSPSFGHEVPVAEFVTTAPTPVIFRVRFRLPAAVEGDQKPD